MTYIGKFYTKKKINDWKNIKNGTKKRTHNMKEQELIELSHKIDNIFENIVDEFKLDCGDSCYSTLGQLRSIRCLDRYTKSYEFSYSNRN